MELNLMTAVRAPGDPAVRDDPKRVKQAASEFEALLLSQMMKAAREGSSLSSLDGSDDSPGGSSTDSVMEYAEQQFGSVLASAGGLGLARLVMTGLESKRATGTESARPVDPN